MKMKQKQNDLVAGTPKKKKKVWIIILVIVAVIVGLIAVFIHNMGKQVEMVTNMVETEPVMMRDLSDTISLKGTVSGESRTNVMSLATAEITAVEVQVGDIVAQGDALVALDRADIEKQVADLEQNVSNSSMLDKMSNQDLQEALSEAQSGQSQELKAAQDAIDSAVSAYDSLKNSKIAAMIEAQKAASTDEERANLTQATKDFISMGYLKDADMIAAQRSIDNARESYADTQKRAIESAQEAIEKAKYSTNDGTSTNKDTLDTLKKQLNDCELKAPCGGVVTAVNVSVGDKNTAGQTLVTIENTSALKMVATVDEKDILKLQEGMNAIVISDATGEEEIQGTVTRVVRVKSQSTGANADMSGGYSVEISLDTTDLLVGMSVKAKVMIKEKGETLAIPYDLIQYDENGDAFVYVAESNSDGSATAVKKNIKVGEEVDYYTEITGGDLKEGDQLIYDYTFSIVEGQTFTLEQMYSNQMMETGDMSDANVEGVE